MKCDHDRNVVETLMQQDTKGESFETPSFHRVDVDGRGSAATSIARETKVPALAGSWRPRHTRSLQKTKEEMTMNTMPHIGCRSMDIATTKQTTMRRRRRLGGWSSWLHDKISALLWLLSLAFAVRFACLYLSIYYIDR
jgi:hypothetical protein